MVDQRPTHQVTFPVALVGTSQNVALAHSQGTVPLIVPLPGQGHPQPPAMPPITANAIPP